MFAVCQFLQYRNSLAQIVVVIRQVGGGILNPADNGNREITPDCTFTKTGIQDRGFNTRIGADNQAGVGPVYSGNGRIKQVSGTALFLSTKPKYYSIIRVYSSNACDESHHELHFDRLSDTNSPTLQIISNPFQFK